MEVTPTALPEVLLVRPRIFADERGRFLETWRRERYAAAGLPGDFVQDNVSHSRRGVVRGLHYQWPCAQGKLVSVLAGEVFDVAVDVRRGSPDFGRWVGARLSAENGHQLYVPEGFAHGFVVTSAWATVLYKCTEVYVPAAEHAIRWDDPAIGIAWPLPPGEAVLSAKDLAAPVLDAVPGDDLPGWVPVEAHGR